MCVSDSTVIRINYAPVDAIELSLVNTLYMTRLHCRPCIFHGHVPKIALSPTASYMHSLPFTPCYVTFLDPQYHFHLHTVTSTLCLSLPCCHFHVYPQFHFHPRTVSSFLTWPQLNRWEAVNTRRRKTLIGAPLKTPPGIHLHPLPRSASVLGRVSRHPLSELITRRSEPAAACPLARTLFISALIDVNPVISLINRYFLHKVHD